ncbi:MAG TPA: hypothetical protein ENN21_05560 [Spirochaetes bacterium]|nr:hypothetical protein [Spirochaetota bacterium]
MASIFFEERALMGFEGYREFAANRKRIVPLAWQNEGFVKIVFDMDNTLTDTRGVSKRPGIDALLDRLCGEGHELVLWTNSPGARARDILEENGLDHYFSRFIFREDYDPGSRGLPKDIRKIGGDVLVDDDPEEVRFNRTNKKKAVLVKSYVSPGTPVEKDEHEKLYKEIIKKPRLGFLKG